MSSTRKAKEWLHIIKSQDAPVPPLPLVAKNDYLDVDPKVLEVRFERRREQEGKAIEAYQALSQMIFISGKLHSLKNNGHALAEFEAANQLLTATHGTLCQFRDKILKNKEELKSYEEKAQLEIKAQEKKVEEEKNLILLSLLKSAFVNAWAEYEEKGAKHISAAATQRVNEALNMFRTTKNVHEAIAYLNNRFFYDLYKILKVADPMVLKFHQVMRLETEGYFKISIPPVGASQLSLQSSPISAAEVELKKMQNKLASEQERRQEDIRLKLAAYHQTLEGSYLQVQKNIEVVVEQAMQMCQSEIEWAEREYKKLQDEFEKGKGRFNKHLFMTAAVQAFFETELSTPLGKVVDTLGGFKSDIQRSKIKIGSWDDADDYDIRDVKAVEDLKNNVTVLMSDVAAFSAQRTKDYMARIQTLTEKSQKISTHLALIDQVIQSAENAARVMMHRKDRFYRGFLNAVSTVQLASDKQKADQIKIIVDLLKTHLPAVLELLEKKKNLPLEQKLQAILEMEIQGKSLKQACELKTGSFKKTQVLTRLKTDILNILSPEPRRVDKHHGIK